MPPPEAPLPARPVLRFPPRMAGTDCNQPCPCGSGRKFKRCCAGAEPHNAAVKRRDEEDARRRAEVAAERAAREERLARGEWEPTRRPMRRNTRTALAVAMMLGGFGGMKP